METVSFIIMDNLFNEYAYTEEYKNIILEPLNADEMLNVNKMINNRCLKSPYKTNLICRKSKIPRHHFSLYWIVIYVFFK